MGKDGTRAVKRDLTREEKKRRIVLKRVNLDPEGIRKTFLKSGTMARVRHVHDATASGRPDRGAAMLIKQSVLRPMC